MLSENRTEKTNCFNPYIFDQGTNNNVVEKDVDEVTLALTHMAKYWERRAQVKRENPAESIPFDEEKDDYLEELLPFRHHAAWQQASETLKKRVLSYGWLIYNWKTINIETEIITPVCNDILFNKLPGTRAAGLRKSIVQALVDESYHTLMAENACQIVQTERNLDVVDLNDFDLIHLMNKHVSTQSSEWKKTLTRFATATVSETLVSDYLKKISEADNIQPLCQITTDIHRRDELSHANIFGYMMKNVYACLDNKQRQFFISVLPKAVEWFASKELRLWSRVLEAINFPNYKKMISDCQSTGGSELDVIDYSGVKKLLNKLDVDVDQQELFLYQ